MSKTRHGMKEVKEKIHGLRIRLCRYFLFGIQMIFQEKSRGLDFTMRDTRLFEKSMGKYHGYSKTDEKHLREIFHTLDFTRDLCLLDVGCGKGVVLKEAAGFPFRKITGIEVQPEILKTAQRNLKRLGLEEKADCICADAAGYDGYGEYNVFFFFNPFDGETLCTVMEKIKESRKAGEPFIVIYHNPVYLSVMEEYLPGATRKILHDTRKDYDTCIWYSSIK